MNFLNLRYFIIAAEEMSFTKAAKRLYISQQSLSSHIAKLEDYFGVPLFDRHPPLTLTDAGQSLLKNARRILDSKKQAELELQDIRDFRSAELTIGVTSARGAVMMPPLLAEFKRRFPQIRVHLIEGTSSEITEALYKGAADLTLGFEVDDAENIESVRLHEEYTIVAVPRQLMMQHLSGREQAELYGRKTIRLSAVQRCPFVRMKTYNWLGSIFEGCCREEKIEPVIAMETSNIMTMIMLCAKGIGAILCPHAFLEEGSPYYNEEIRRNTVQFELDYGPSRKNISANYMKKKYHSRAAQEFIAIAQEMMK